MYRGILRYNGKDYLLSGIYIENMCTFEIMIFPGECGIFSGNEVYKFRTLDSDEYANKRIDICNHPEKYLAEEAINKYLEYKEKEFTDDIDENKHIILPHTIGNITFYDKQELIDWIEIQQKQNEKLIKEKLIMSNEQVREKFKEEEFTEDELALLKLAFKLVDDVVEVQRTSNSDVYMCNELYNLKEKLGIDDLVE